jgi:hypothetical protein
MILRNLKYALYIFVIWCNCVIVKIPKKGALSDCNNWRGITLSSVPRKILAKIIIRRMSDAVDSILRDQEATRLY